ncbi:hypothetical protein SPF06_14315 [Sinomonas sp. JGH33]|uniref:Transcriptional regulator, AbiEi antitoxin, Type IV TA system n=1 Tax=Sinomonas terricola TaxID=3110330 RepID=A0ABU5T8D7_9MICC|nr:hypothetical protein [Sinomonas sp. JGH33]MEA5455905.1 hypothetical protein [Sinomonas sp. JGH33]
MDATGHVVNTSLRQLEGPGSDARRAFASGRLIRLRRGFYVPTGVWLKARPDARFRMALEAHAWSNPSAVFCGETALFLRGIPTVKAPMTIDVATGSNGRLGLQPSTFAVRGGSEAASQARHITPPPVRRRLRRALAAEDVDGYLAVPLAEALTEVLASGKFARALTVADGVLRHDPDMPLLERPDLRDALARLPHRTQRARAERVASLARAGAESPGESVSRAIMHLYGFPEPVLQREHSDALGFVGRTDFAWDEAPEPVGEFDGWGKYFQSELTAGQDPQDIFRKEKRRENRLLALGHPVLRWDWADLEQPLRLRAKLLEGGLRPTRGRVAVEKIS